MTKEEKEQYVANLRAFAAFVEAGLPGKLTFTASGDLDGRSAEVEATLEAFAGSSDVSIHVKLKSKADAA